MIKLNRGGNEGSAEEFSEKKSFYAGCKWIYGHKQSGSNITTRGDYIITQYAGNLCKLLGLDYCVSNSSDYWEQGTSSTDPSKNWSWQQYGYDGAHAYAMSNYYYIIDYKGYPDPIIRQTGSTYYIDYGAVDMKGLTGSEIDNHLQVNPDCTELPCPSGTTNQGTFYNHTAATAGTSLRKDSTGFKNEIAPDSVCPKGWMLPMYWGTTDYPLYNKSYSFLLFTAYGGREVSSGGANADVIALYPPISLLRASMYVYYDSLIGNPGTEGRYWGSRIHPTSAGASSGLQLKTGAIQGTSFVRGYGFSVRCVSRS